ncbi:MAG: ABC transporter permease [Elusimicrobiota bacterium]
MANSILNIPVPNLLLILIPVAVVIGIYSRWSLGAGTPVYAACRMVLQLVLVGYALTYVFESKHPAIVYLVLCMMLTAASWIALRPLAEQRRKLYWKAALAVGAGSLPILALVTGGVLRLDPWFAPRYLIPLAGMIFANSMNSLSLAAERFDSELKGGADYQRARNAAYRACLLPLMNMFFAMGLVSLPGMMTGQILSGTDPLIAIRYQILVMCMVFGASGITAAVYLTLLKPDVSASASAER